MSRRRNTGIAALCVSAACGRVDFAPLDDAARSADSLDSSGVTDACLGHPGVLFCNGFETGLLPWRLNGPGTVSIDETNVHDGGSAAITLVNDQPDFIALYSDLPLAGETALHGRAWFYIPSGTAYGHVDLFEFEASAGQGVTAYVSAEKFAIYSDVGGGGFAVEGAPIQRDRWFCLELSVTVSDNAGVIDLSIDGASMINEPGLVTNPVADAYAHIVTGIGFTGPGQFGPAKHLIDGVIVDTKPIGCTD